MTPIVYITKMDGGGMESFCLELLHAWVAQGIKATLYASYTGGARYNDVPSGVERVCWNVRAKNCIWRLARWLRTRSEDPCLVLNQELAVVLIILKKFRLIRNRIYYRESTDVACHYNLWFKLLMRCLWPSFDGIIEQSRAGVEATRSVCNGRLPPCLIARNIVCAGVAGNGIGSLHMSQPVRLACVGSFKPMKGQRRLVENLALDVAADWTLAFWGDGEERDSVELLARAKSLASRIMFNDWVRDKEQVYASCDVVVIPSDYEGLPNVMLEAILRGKRVSVRPTCVGACELLTEIGIGETWPWRKAMEIPQETWRVARTKLARLCDPETVARGIADFMGVRTLCAIA